MSEHGIASGNRIATKNSLEQEFMVQLASFRAIAHREDKLALFAEQSNDRIDKGKHDRILSSQCQSPVKIVVSGNVVIGAVEIRIHCGNCLAHSGNFSFT